MGGETSASVVCSLPRIAHEQVVKPKEIPGRDYSDVLITSSVFLTNYKFEDPDVLFYATFIEKFCLGNSTMSTVLFCIGVAPMTVQGIQIIFFLPEIRSRDQRNPLNGILLP